MSLSSHDVLLKRQYKNDELAYNQLLRRFNQAVKMINCPKLLTMEKMGEVLTCLSFVCLEES